jgi:hypothetical protein
MQPHLRDINPGRMAGGETQRLCPRPLEVPSANSFKACCSPRQVASVPFSLGYVESGQGVAAGLPELQILNANGTKVRKSCRWADNLIVS